VLRFIDIAISDIVTPIYKYMIRDQLSIRVTLYTCRALIVYDLNVLAIRIGVHVHVYVIIYTMYEPEHSY
jgi:hypothetical protein